MALPKPVQGNGGVCPSVEAALLKKWLSVSESQICAIEVLCAQLPEVRVLLENNMTGISERFIDIAAHFETYDNAVKKLLAASSADASGQFAAEAGHLPEAITSAVGSVIVDMQFQDRVSQNLVITVNVLNAIVKYLQDEIDVTIESQEKKEGRAKLDAAFASSLIAFLTLGELQHKFVNHLMTHGYISDPAEIGYDPGSGEQQENGEIDLF